MPPCNARGRAKSLTGACGARGARGARRNHDEEDNGNHQESVMGGGASARRNNVGGAPPTVLGGAEFMQGVFTAIEQVVRNTVQTMQVPGVVCILSITRGCLPMVEDHGGSEEEKAKQFMRGLRLSIKNKIAGNLIKVYSTMVRSAAAIEETLNETRKIQNPKSQSEGTSNQSEGHSSKKPRNSTAQQQYTTRSLHATSIVSSGQTSRGGSIYFGYHQPGHRVVNCPLKGQQRQSQ
ncbi:hypothetical protein Acr_10g0010110 [Actinidia rufa]|uniref:Uncharacterized protein n=1 Tax=Actinidia rufa TaxID=165716 RepID=A0A7J0FB28_9ERIC|nr:hypothetical protein Acr_10g0010110 [Actinidia rufa]